MLQMLLREMPPLAARSYAGLAAACLFAILAIGLRVPLGVPRHLWGRLCLAALLNVTAWMGFTTLGLLWLSAAEAAIIAYTMPVWAALLGWPILGERPRSGTVLGLILGVGGVVILFAGRGVAVGMEKLPGLLLLLGAAILFAFGAVRSKRHPLPMPPLAATVWQVGLGCVPMMLASMLFETADIRALSGLGWFLLGWMAVVALGLSYLTWFGAMARLPASTATLGTLLVPVVAVLGTGLFLDVPLGLREWAALGCTLLGVVLAVRSGVAPA